MQAIDKVDWLPLLGAGLVGAALSVVFIGGLALTVQRGLHSPHPARWFLTSMLVRTAIVLGGFWLTAGTDWRKMLACLAGFGVARVIVTHLGAKRLGVTGLDKETRDAP